VALDPGGAGDDPDRQAVALEDRPLLDVELEVGDGGVEPRPRPRGRIEVDPVGGERVDQADAVAVLDVVDAARVDRPGRQARPEQGAPEPRALLVGPVDQRDGHGRLTGGGERAQDLEPTEHPERAVEPAAVGHRVDVAAEDDGPVARAREHGPEIAGLVDVDLHRQLGQALAQPVAGRRPRVRPRDALRALLVLGALAQGAQVGEGAVGVDLGAVRRGHAQAT